MTAHDSDQSDFVRSRSVSPVRVDLSADLAAPVVYPASARVGLISDSHGQANRTRKAVDRLLEIGVDVLLHLGDVCCLTVLDSLAGLEQFCVDVRVVFGNCDYDWRSMSEYARFLGLKVDHPLGRIRIGPHLVCFAHGDEVSHLRSSVAEGARYFCHGHTHEICDLQEMGTRIVNPGALHRSRSYTVAWLEPATDRLVYVPIEGC